VVKEQNKKEGGRRFQEESTPKNKSGYPVISIISVVYNDREGLATTLKNINQQTYPGIEYIIIDGGSDDGTVELIESETDKIDYWLSEPDEGIYDGMNKGIEAATGDFVWFMNAADVIHNSETLSNIYEQHGFKGDVYFGETNLVDESYQVLGTRSELTTRQLPKELTPKSMARGMVVCHQSFIARKSIVPYYELQYPCSADIDWVITCLKRSAATINTQLILSHFLVGGYSGQHRKSCLKERFDIYVKHFGYLYTLIMHVYIGVRYLYYKLFKTTKI
jgi:glycosyltransferase involved in cell wall biosynthesis